MSILKSTALIVLLGLSPIPAQSEDDDYEPVSVTLGGRERIPRTLDAYILGGFGLLPLQGTELSSIYDTYEHYKGLEGKRLNYGKGLKLETGVAWYMHTHLGLEAAFEYSRHLPKLETEHSTHNPPFVESYDIRMFGPKLMLKPVITPFSSVRLYGSAGIGAMFTKLTYENSAPVYSHQGYIETSPGFLLETGLGMEIPLGSRISATTAATIQRVYFETEERVDTEGHTHVIDESITDDSDPYREKPVDISGSNLAIRAGIRVRIF